MDKKELLVFCKYYKGEKTNPNKPSTAWYVWAVEKDWVEEMTLDDVVNDCVSKSLDRYMSLGYADFEKFDDTPITLKAVLFSLFEKWNEGMVTREDFSAFYTKWRDGKI